MGKKSRRKRERRRQNGAKPANVPGRVGLQFNPDGSILGDLSALLPPDMGTVSAQARADAAWFAEHPDVNEFRRPATAAEREEQNLPEGVEVVVHRLACGAQVRVFPEPQS